MCFLCSERHRTGDEFISDTKCPPCGGIPIDGEDPRYQELKNKHAMSSAESDELLYIERRMSIEEQLKKDYAAGQLLLYTKKGIMMHIL